MLVTVAPYKLREVFRERSLASILKGDLPPRGLRDAVHGGPGQFSRTKQPVVSDDNPGALDPDFFVCPTVSIQKFSPPTPPELFQGGKMFFWGKFLDEETVFPAPGKIWDHGS